MSDIIIFGGDGYIGWPLALELASRHRDKDVIIADNYLTRRNAAKIGGAPFLPIASLADRVQAACEVLDLDNLKFQEIDASDPDAVTDLFRSIEPEVVYHLAHQRAAPYSMLGLREAIETITNNEVSFLNLIWSIKDMHPDCHLIKLGSFGAYKKSAIDVSEGDAVMEYKGKSSEIPVPYPRASDDIYHITKINDSNLAGLACRKWNLIITEVMQSTVSGAATAKSALDPRLHTRIDYDEILGTVLNRFMIQAVAGVPMMVYGNGRQTTGIMGLEDCVQALAVLAYDPAEPGRHRIVNNCPQIYPVIDLARIVQKEARALGITAELSVNEYNPRFEDDSVPDYAVETTYIDGILTVSTVESVVQSSLQLLYSEINTQKVNVSSMIPKHSWTQCGTDAIGRKRPMADRAFGMASMQRLAAPSGRAVVKSFILQK